MAQPYPLYQDYTFAQSGEPVGPDAIRLPRPSKEYMEGYRKDFNSYFENGAEKIPDPIDAGYWPYKTADGLEARGRAGEAGKLLRSWVAMDSMASDAPLGKGGDDVSKEEYIDQEADAAYQNDMRFYTNDDWP